MNEVKLTRVERSIAAHFAQAVDRGENAFGKAVVERDGPVALGYFAGLALAATFIGVSVVLGVLGLAVVAMVGQRTALVWASIALGVWLFVLLGWSDLRFVQYSKARRRFRSGAT